MKKSRIWKVIVILIVAAVALHFAYEAGKDFVRAIYDARTPRPTIYPAATVPDQVCLTWSDNPISTQTVQWRTAAEVLDGAVQFRKADDAAAAPAETSAEPLPLSDPLIVNNPAVTRFSAKMAGLAPGTAYAYRVGSKTTNSWSDWFEFNTAPQTTQAFSFLYFGDVQIGYPTWGKLLDDATQNNPDAAFCLVAGDLVNRGNNRNEWDGFFNAGAAVLGRLPLVPTIGNHECPGGKDPWLYLQTLTLPENGPENIPAERAYSFRYSNALFVVLDSNLSPADQRPWLDQQLSTSNDTWKFVMYHHPAYSSSERRDNDEVRDHWGDLFDKYHVDIAFQGHDHAYLRTPPMKNGQPVASPAEGTIYVLAVAGDKFYEAGDFDYAAVTIEKTPTWQVIDITAGAANTLAYRAFDLEGKLRDEFTIEKTQ